MFTMRPKPNCCVFVIVQDFGHFGYTTHIAHELHMRGYDIEYWSHELGRKQCPGYAKFYSLTDKQEFTDFYCKESSFDDDDLTNILRMSGDINSLIKRRFGDTNPLVDISGTPDSIHSLKIRLLCPDVALVVNDQCHVFAWVGEFCKNMNVAVLNLCPSQHEIQRQHAGVLDQWRCIFGNINTWPQICDGVSYAPVVRGDEETPFMIPYHPGHYITHPPLVANMEVVELLGRDVVGAVIMPAECQEDSRKSLRGSGELIRWLDDFIDARPVVFLSLGSMVKETFSEHCIRVLFEALCSSNSLTKWRVLTTIPRDVAAKYVPAACVMDHDLFCVGWCPQFAILEHVNVKVFISHCGANSVHEAIYHRVPIIACPFFDDQRYNGPKMVELKCAVSSVLKESVTTDEMIANVEVALGLRDRDKYGEIMEHLSLHCEMMVRYNALDRLIQEAEKLISFMVSHPPKKPNID